MRFRSQYVQYMLAMETTGWRQIKHRSRAAQQEQGKSFLPTWSGWGLDSRGQKRQTRQLESTSQRAACRALSDKTIASGSVLFFVHSACFFFPGRRT